MLSLWPTDPKGLIAVAEFDTLLLSCSIRVSTRTRIAARAASMHRLSYALSKRTAAEKRHSGRSSVSFPIIPRLNNAGTNSFPMSSLVLRREAKGLSRLKCQRFISLVHFCTHVMLSLPASEGSWRLALQASGIAPPAMQRQCRRCAYPVMASELAPAYQQGA